ncbi:MAG: hypothetical protein WAM66_13640 [Acidobacteriaceae bacterium]
MESINQSTELDKPERYQTLDYKSPEINQKQFFPKCKPNGIKHLQKTDKNREKYFPGNPPHSSPKHGLEWGQRY